MGKQQFELPFGIREVIFGSTGRQGLAIPCQRQRIDREEGEKVILAKGRDHGSFGEFETDGNGLSAEPRAQRGDHASIASGV